MIVGRIFQRVPDLLHELEDQVEEEGGSQTARKRILIELVLEKVCHSLLCQYFKICACLQIEEVCQDVELAHDLGVPSKLTNYLAYIDLVLLRLTFNTSN